MRSAVRTRCRVFVVLALVAVIAMPVVACSSTNAATDLQRFYTQQLSWGPCAPFAPTKGNAEAYDSPQLECTYLQVPIDYGQPDGKIAQIAVLRVTATRLDQRIGSLVVNPGGPGFAGTAWVAWGAQDFADSQLGQRFDLVGFDPRGVGASKPSIQCYTPQERDADRLELFADGSPPGVARTEAIRRDFGGKCAQRSGKDLLANSGTRDVARDMDLLRAALGDEKLTYLGYSYGTRLGYTYAEQFPRNVRALLLDGAMDPDQSITDWVVAQGTGFQRTFDAFAVACAKYPDCALGGDPVQATDNFRKLVLPLIDRPLPLPDGRKLSYRDAITGTMSAMYTQRAWNWLHRGLRDLSRGEGQELMELADSYLGRQDDGSYSLQQDAYNAIRCVDDKPVADPVMAEQANRRYRQAAPIFDEGRGPNAAREVCAFWPVPHTSEPHEPKVTGLPPVMVISVTGDPATPYQAGVKLAKALNARLLTVEGTQHVAALKGNKCVDDFVSAYLIELKLPPEEARCSLAAG